MSGENRGSAREALIAEMLGDIGKLHDAVEQLKTELPEALQPLADLRASLESARNNLLIASDEAKELQQAHIAELLVASKNELREEARTQIENAALAIQARASQAVVATTNALSSTIEREVKTALDSAEFDKIGKELKAALDVSVVKARQAVSDFDRDLKRQARANAPMGFWAQIGWMVGAVVFTAATMAVVLYPMAQSAEPQSVKAAKQ